MAKDYYTVPDKATGDQFTEAMWDDSIKTNINNLRVPPMCIARRNAAQSINSNTETAVSFDTQDVDTDGMFAATSTNITVQTSGVYSLVGMVKMDVIDAQFICRIKVGGTMVAEQRFHVSGGADLVDAMTLSTVKSLAPSDVVTMTIFQTNGASAAKNTASTTQLAVTWLGQVS